jgi:hypothetical protein
VTFASQASCTLLAVGKNDTTLPFNIDWAFGLGLFWFGFVLFRLLLFVGRILVSVIVVGLPFLSYHVSVS